MSIIDSNLKFIGIDPSYPTSEKKSSQVNNAQEVVTMADIMETVYEGLPSPSNPPVEPQPNDFYARTATGSALNPNTYYNGPNNDGVGATITFNSVGKFKEASFNAGIAGNVVVNVGDVILNRAETTANRFKQGRYVLTENSNTTNCVLTRCDDYDETSEINTSQVNVTEGDNGGRIFIQQTANPTIGTSPIVYVLGPNATPIPFLPMYVDNILDSPLDWNYANGVNTARPGINATYTAPTNGVFPIINDVNPYVGMTVLLVNETNSAYNGHYALTQLGSASLPSRLTRQYSNVFANMRFQFARFICNNPQGTKFGQMWTLKQTTIIPDSQIGTAALNFVQAPISIPTLQEVLDNNHDLLDGNFFAGTDAGVDNSNTDVVAIGTSAGNSNAGDGLIGIGFKAGQSQSGRFVNAFGNSAGVGNTADDVNAFGNSAGVDNGYAHVNLFGNSAQATADGQTVLSKDGTIMARIDTTLLTDSRKYVLPDISGTFALINIADDFANDADAEDGGVPIGRLYHHNGNVKIRLV